jgi:hypothetical protein
VATTVECLNCGATRCVQHDLTRRIHDDACRRCGYVGWASAEDLTESTRRALRDQPLRRRRCLLALS